MRVLFCTPFGGRSGSELLLWHLMAATQGQVQAGLYSEHPAAMAKQLPAGVPYFTNPFNQNGWQGKWTKLQNALGKSVYTDYFREIHRRFRPDVWYLNTVMMAHLAPILDSFGAKYVVHFHELPHIHFEPVKYQHLKALIEGAGLVIGNTEATCQMLRTLGIQQPRLVYPFVERNLIKPRAERAAALRSQLGIPPEAFVWVSIGAATYVKGIEYWPQVAAALPQCYFVWVGQHTNSGSFYYTESVIRSLGLSNVHLVGPQRDDYYDYFAAADALLLMSREESFGMVNIEAAHLGKPVVSFKSGGVDEVVRPGSGLIVDSLHLSDLTEAMLRVMNNTAGFDHQQALRNIEPFDADLQVNRWLGFMNEYLHSIR